MTDRPARGATTTTGRRRTDGPWLSISAAARALGISPSTLRLWASEGRIPHVRTAGGHRRFNPDQLRGWLAEQPSRPGRAGRRSAARVEPSPHIADALRACSDEMVVAVEALVDGPTEAAYRRLAPAERREAVHEWVANLADAFETGSLSLALDRAESYGRAHAGAGSSAELTLGANLALERAVENALRESDPDLPAEDLLRVGEAVERLTARVAGAWAEVASERSSPPTP
jgi:excisionase family DNA binding protein